MIYISTDYKLDLLRLVAILEGKVCEDNAGHHSSSKDATGASDYRKLIESCLSRVHVLYCNSTTELIAVLHSLKTFLHTHPEVCALVLDNVASYYWVDRCESVRGDGTSALEYRQQQWVGALGELAREYHLVVFTAKPLLFEPREKGQSDKVGVHIVPAPSDDIERFHHVITIPYTRDKPPSWCTTCTRYRLKNPQVSIFVAVLTCVAMVFCPIQKHYMYTTSFCEDHHEAPSSL